MSDQKNSKMKKAFSSRRFKLGAYQTVISIIVIVAVIFINLVVTKADISVDLTTDKMYTLTDASKKMAKGLTDKISIYYIVEEGKEKDMIEKVVNQYDALSKNISVVKKDPVVYPKFASTYTQDEVSDNDVIVVDETTGRSEHVLVADMIITTVNYSTYQQEPSELDAEGRITAALQSVSSRNQKKVYLSKGHGEADLSASFTNLLEKSNFKVETTRLDEAAGIPKDCDILIVNGPTYDLVDKDIATVTKYLQAGGDAMFMMNPTVNDSNQTRYEKLLTTYGVQAQKGYVIEDMAHAFQSSQVLMVPKVETHDITSDVDTSKDTIMLGTKGFKVMSKVRSTLTVSPLLTSSNESFSRVDSKASAMTMIDGDIAGPFSVAVAAEDKYREVSSKVLILGSSCFSTTTTYDLMANDQYANRGIMLGAMNWIVGEKVDALAVPTRSLAQQTLAVPEGERTIWIITLIVVVPACILIAGFVVWYRRRKR